MQRKRWYGVFTVVVMAAMLMGLSLSASAQQASLTVSCGTVNVCNANNTSWELDKSLDTTSGDFAQGTGSITWMVTVTKGSTTANTLTYMGSLTITNTGSAPATIGNIVINLQRKPGPGAQFATVSSDVADATQGDLATTAKICSGASRRASRHLRKTQRLVAWSSPMRTRTLSSRLSLNRPLLLAKQ